MAQLLTDSRGNNASEVSFKSIAGQIANADSVAVQKLPGGTFHFWSRANNLQVVNCSKYWQPLDLKATVQQSPMIAGRSLSIDHSTAFPDTGNVCHHEYVVIGEDYTCAKMNKLS